MFKMCWTNNSLTFFLGGGVQQFATKSRHVMTGMHRKYPDHFTCCSCYWSLLYSAGRLRQTRCALVMCDSKWVTVAFYCVFWKTTKVVYLQHCFVVMWLVPHETTAILVHSVYTIQPCIMSCHSMQSHIRRVHAYLAGTCCLHFWQIDWDLLHATGVTRGWNRYQNKSQHRKLTLEKKILLPLLVGLEPTTFWWWVWCSDHWPIPALLKENLPYIWPMWLMTSCQLSCSVSTTTCVGHSGIHS